MNEYPWSLLQTFLTVAKHGSLTAAAFSAGSSQPTFSRQIALLEDAMGARLFERSKSGAELTPEGKALLKRVKDMAVIASELPIQSERAAPSLNGTVRITASRVVATYLLPDLLSRLRVEEPGIDIELVASDQTENLLFREADIALRMFRPSQLDVVTKKVTDLELGIYASHDYLNRMGTPDSLEEIQNHDFVGYDRSDLIIQGFKRLGKTVGREFFAFRSDDQVACWSMVVAGFGIGFNQVKIGARETRVQRILPDLDIGSMPVWLTAHSAVKNNLRIRRVFDFLDQAF